VVPNQFNAGKSRPPFKRRDDQVTRETIALALLYAALAFLAAYGLISLAAS